MLHRRSNERSCALVTIAIAFLIAACAPASNIGPPQSQSTPAATSSDASSPSARPDSTHETLSAAPIGWQPASPMVHPRAIFRAVLLTDGTVLVVGDDDCEVYRAVAGSERAEVYDAATDRWVEVGSLNKPRGRLQLVALPDGTAMVLGGFNQDEESFSSTKIYSPNERTWSPGPLMLDIPVQGAAALPDGTVVAVVAHVTEILDVGAGAWRRSKSIGELSTERLVLLSSRHALALGTYPDWRSDEIKVFDADREVWKQFAFPSSVPPWSDMVAFDDGSMLLLGSDEGGSRVERYDRAKARWIDAAPMHEGRIRPQMARLRDGRVLVAGGMSLEVQLVDAGGTSVSEAEVLDTTEIYDPTSDSWTPGPRLLTPRQAGFATALPDGSVLVYGGYLPTPNVGGEQDTGNAGECPTPIPETERLYAVP